MQTGELIQKLQQDAALAHLLPALAAERREGRWLSTRELLQADTLAALLADFARQEGHPDGDGRAIASLWSRWHFWAMLPPFVAALLLHRHAPALQAIQLSPGCRTCGLEWRAPSQALGNEAARKACELAVRQAAPLIERLAGVSGASPKVFWNNLGNLLEYVVAELRTRPGACPQMLLAFDALLDEPCLADGSHNPVQRPVRYVPDTPAGTQDPRRIRKICCLYYLLPETDVCGNCPRPAPRHHHVRT